MKSTPKKVTVAALKAELTLRGLSVVGLKQELMDRIEADDLSKNTTNQDPQPGVTPASPSKASPLKVASPSIHGSPSKGADPQSPTKSKSPVQSKPFAPADSTNGPPHGLHKPVSPIKLAALEVQLGAKPLDSALTSPKKALEKLLDSPARQVESPFKSPSYPSPHKRKLEQDGIEHTQKSQKQELNYLHIFNLVRPLSETGLRSIVGGNPEYIWINKIRSFAYLGYSSQSAADACLLLNGKVLQENGREIQVVKVEKSQVDAGCIEAASEPRGSPVLKDGSRKSTETGKAKVPSVKLATAAPKDTKLFSEINHTTTLPSITWSTNYIARI